ncbi:protein odr-4 homolog isoform X2 [Pseudophryne corroboree]|uniref:protein odr-4 homolog isoform X2 n=1 Tax=Pseudophryne corroboree TaxID=495146 RepID=UPI003081BD2E
MGRSYYVDEAVEKYLAKIIQQKKSYVTGLIIGQCSLQRDYILLAVQTPTKEDQCKGPEKKAGLCKLDEIDEEWVSVHASQVSRMLPGGLQLVGVFLITSPEISKESQNALRKLIFAVEKSSRKNRLWSLDDNDITDRVALQICSATRKITCRTFDVSDPKSTAKPADWKYQSTSSSWLTIECNINVDLTFPLSSATSYQDQQKGARKKSRIVAHSCPQIISANILTSPNSSNRSTATVHVLKSSLNIQGVVKCRGYVCNNKPKVKDAMQAIKRDILNTISDRCEILFEDIMLNGSEREYEESRLLPQRLFIPLPGSSTMLCDYVFGDETEEDLKTHFLEMLDQEVQYDALDFPEEQHITDKYVYPCNGYMFRIPAAEILTLESLQPSEHRCRHPNQVSTPTPVYQQLESRPGTTQREQQHDSYKSDNPTSTETCTLKKDMLSSKGHQNMGLVIATAVALLAVLISFHYLSE